MAAMMSMAAIIGPLLMTNLFSFFTREEAPAYFPGAPFIAGAILTIISLLLCIRSLVKYHTPAVQPQTADDAMVEIK